MEEITEQIKVLEQEQDDIQRKLNAQTDHFFIYGLVKQIEEIDRKILALQSKLNNQ